MGEFKSQWERAHRSLSGLTNSQKLATGLLITGIVVATYWLTQQSAHIAMVPVLDQSFADADLMQIGQHLSEQKVPHEVRDGKVYVPSDRKLEVLSDLIYTDTFISSTESGFDTLIKQSSIFDTPSKADKMFNRAREQTLQSVIGRFRGVRKATVVIDPTNERHISGGSITPSALVDIQTRGNEAMPRQLASAAVNTLCGAVSTMSHDRVKVTIDGASYNLGAEEMDGDIFEVRQHCEQGYVTKVRQLLSYIPDVLVSVSVDVNVQSIDSETHTVDEDHSAKIESHAETRIEQGTPAADATAVLANAVPEAADKVTDPTSAPRVQETKTDYTVIPGQTVQKTHTPAGKETVLSASVVVPRGYIVQLYRRGATKAVEPTDALLQPIIDAQLSKIHQLVKTSLGLKNDADVTVDIYDDGSTVTVATPPADASVVNEQAAVVPQLSSLWNRHWGYIVLGAATLLMASMVLRRGSGAMAAPQPVDRSPMSASRLPAMTPAHRSRLDEHVDDEGDKEEDDSALLRQVRELATARPEDAARVLREWIYQG